MHLLWHTVSHNPRPPRSRHHPDGHGRTLSGNLARHCMRLPDHVSPVASSNMDNRELGKNDGATDGGGDLLGALDAEVNMAVGVTNNDESLELGELAGTGLLLGGYNLHDLVFDVATKETADDLMLLNGNEVEVDLLETGNLSLFHEAAKLGNRQPLLYLIAPDTAPVAPASAIPAPEAVTIATAALRHEVWNG
ncbi:hypothetical protein BHM03_00028775 [Ensete ventricosum]|nr:hypothetical protein BHM03_00028775 [Ensete ventricosum]